MNEKEKILNIILSTTEDIMFMEQQEYPCNKKMLKEYTFRREKKIVGNLEKYKLKPKHMGWKIKLSTSHQKMTEKKVFFVCLFVFKKRRIHSGCQVSK